MSDLKNTPREFLSVLVLGPSNIRISYFIKLLSAYIKYETCDEVMSCESNLQTSVRNVKETSSDIIEIGKHKFHFIDTPGLQKTSKIYKEIIDILFHFKTGVLLHAIILLIEPDAKGSENYFEQYTAHFFSDLKRYARNILYVVLYNDSCMFDRTYKKLQKSLDSVAISAMVVQKSNVFHLHVETFYTISHNNWEESVNLSKEVFEYLTGDDLKSFYVQSVKPPEKSFLNLIDGLTILLCQVYYLTEFYRLYKRLYCVNDFQKNVTVCYNKDCSGRTEKINVSTQASFTICHEPCNCTQSVLDVKACSIFKAPRNRCSVCNCPPSFHQRYFYKFDAITPIMDLISNEKIVIKYTLLQLFLFLMRHKSITISQFITSVFSWSNDEKRGILEDIKADLEREIILHDKNRVTREQILLSISKLHEIQIMTTVLPVYIRDNFPDGFRLEIISKPLQEASKSYKAEYYSIKKEHDELQELFDEILNPGTSKNASRPRNFRKHPEGESQIKKSGSYKKEYYHIKRKLDELKLQFDDMLNRSSSETSNQRNLTKQYFRKLSLEETDITESDSNREWYDRRVHYEASDRGGYANDNNSYEEPFNGSDHDETSVPTTTDT